MKVSYIKWFEFRCSELGTHCDIHCPFTIAWWQCPDGKSYSPERTGLRAKCLGQTIKVAKHYKSIPMSGPKIIMS